MAHLEETRTERLARVQRERAEQGLPTPATDPTALRMTAAVLRDAARRERRAS